MRSVLRKDKKLYCSFEDEAATIALKTNPTGLSTFVAVQQKAAVILLTG